MHLDTNQMHIALQANQRGSHCILVQRLPLLNVDDGLNSRRPRKRLVLYQPSFSGIGLTVGNGLAAADDARSFIGSDRAKPDNPRRRIMQLSLDTLLVLCQGPVARQADPQETPERFLDFARNDEVVQRRAT